MSAVVQQEGVAVWLVPGLSFGCVQGSCAGEQWAAGAADQRRQLASTGLLRQLVGLWANSGVPRVQGRSCRAIAPFTLHSRTCRRSKGL